MRAGRQLALIRWVVRSTLAASSLVALACQADGDLGPVDRYNYTSMFVGGELALDVHWPDELAPNTGWPSIYVLDGVRHGDAVARAVAERGLAVVVVAVGHLDPAARERDYPPRDDGETGDTAFRRFLVEEAVPFVESRYAVTRRGRSLMGHELSGLFAVSMLLAQTDKTRWFSRIVAASPRIDWADGALLDREVEAAGEARPLVGELAIGWAALEHPAARAYGNELVARLRDRDYADVTVDVIEWTDTLADDSWRPTYEAALDRLVDELGS